MLSFNSTTSFVHTYLTSRHDESHANIVLGPKASATEQQQEQPGLHRGVSAI